jgi:Protein of unknown function (DUF2950)
VVVSGVNLGLADASTEFGATSMSLLIGDHKSSLCRVSGSLLLLIFVTLIASCSQRESAKATVAPKGFASPQAAGQALFDAARSGDQQALLAIFGPDGKDLIFSGDAVKDKNTAARFVSAYEQMNRWSKNQSGNEILYIGADNFAFPIPLKPTGSGQWAFDTAAGKEEVLARRIGDGELTTIGVLTEITNAEQEYFSKNHQFAEKIVSDEGKHNGLYWPVTQGQPASPLGELADVAKALGYSRSDKPQPFDGYYYRILTQQKNSTNGGVESYLEKGKLTGGFAVLAWPAKYHDSGIMTFVVGQDGVVHQKDLGEKTPEAATVVAAYDPSWTVVLAPESANASAGAPNR